MDKLLKVFIGICLLRTGPQHLPESRFLVTSIITLHWVLGVVLSLFTLELPQALLAGLLGSLVPIATVQGLLILHRMSHRLIPTLEALLGTEFLLGLIALPLTAWFYMDMNNRLMPSLLSLFLIGWGIVIATHIFRHALNITQPLAFSFALGYTFIAYSVMGLIAPGG